MRLRKTAVFLTAAAMVFALGGCSKNETADNSNSSDEGGLISDVTQFIEADGREYGKTTVGEMNEEQRNSFFSLNVKKAYRLSSVAERTPNEGYDIIAVLISTKNLFGETIPMGCYDYELCWGDGEDEICSALYFDGDENGYGFEDYPKEKELMKNGELTGWLYFTAPSDAKELLLRYVEYYEDEFEGNTFLVNIGDPEFSPDDIKIEQPTYTSVGVGDRIQADVFAFTINSIEHSDTVGGVSAEDGWEILFADVTVENTSDTPRTILPSSFYAAWGSGDDEYDYGYDPLEFPDEENLYIPLEIQPGETSGGKMIFVVPTNAEMLQIFFFDEEGTGYYEVNF